MSDYFTSAMRLYIERMVDWEGLLALRRGYRSGCFVFQTQRQTPLYLLPIGKLNGSTTQTLGGFETRPYKGLCGKFQGLT